MSETYVYVNFNHGDRICSNYAKLFRKDGLPFHEFFVLLAEGVVQSLRPRNSFHNVTK